MPDSLPATILAIDDNEAARYAIARVLRAAGFAVLEAATGEEGLRLASAADLVLLDVNLPDLDGFAVCRRIRENPSTANLPVIHVSATMVTGLDQVHGLEGGADAYLTHPLEPPVLVATVNAFLRTREAERALRASEARWRAIVAALREGITVRNQAGELTFANASFQRMVGTMDDPFAATGDRLFREDGAPVEPPSHTTLRTGQPLVNVEVGFCRADGEEVWLSVSSQPIPDPLTGAAAAVVSSYVDATERHRSEEERERLLASERAARRDAERANRLKDDFLATLSHELRTPLNAITGWAQVLRMPTATAEDFGAGLLAIERNARMQAEMISDLLDVSRIISGKLRLGMCVQPAAPILEAALASVLGAAQAKQLRIHRDFDLDAAPVLADPARLQQIVWNLFSNAVKFTPAAGEIFIGLRQSGGHVEITVRDTGQGIAPRLLPHVFERFIQADASTTRATGGLGLGLAIVKQLVDLHGGTVTAASPGESRGATFTVRLPAAAGEMAAPAAASTVAADALPSFHLRLRSLEGVRVLVVDDDADARTLVDRFLGECHATVKTAANARDAFELVRSWKPDVLLADLGMPERDGYQLIREVRAHGPSAKLPAIALTAFARPEDRSRALAEGFQAHITKPLDPNRLIEIIADWTTGQPKS